MSWDDKHNNVERGVALSCVTLRWSKSRPAFIILLANLEERNFPLSKSCNVNLYVGAFTEFCITVNQNV